LGPGITTVALEKDWGLAGAFFRQGNGKGVNPGGDLKKSQFCFLLLLYTGFEKGWGFVLHFVPWVKVFDELIYSFRFPKGNKKAKI